VMGMLGLLLETKLDDQQRRWALVARESADALLALINDILDISKIEAGKIDIERIAFSPSALVDSVESLLQPRAQAKGLALTVTIAPDVPAWVMGDPTRWRQILFNLLGNAIKFTERGCVGVDVQWRPSLTAPGRLFVAVRDSGIGMSSEEEQRLFKIFAQADQSIARRFGGSGLGLAICRQLVDCMGGRIGVASEPGKGSTFWFWVPTEPAEAPAIDQIPEDVAASANQHQLRILVAEDNAVNQMVIRTMLARAGHRVDTVGDGSEAVTAVQHGGYDLVLMDMQMPEMDGLSAAKAIRRLAPPIGEVPIVALTANASATDRDRVIEAGMNDHVAKPIEPVKLFAAIARVSGAAPPPQAAQAQLRPTAPAPSADALSALDAFIDTLDEPASKSAA